MAKVNKSKLNIPMALACVLLCLTLFSVYLVGGIYARYIVTGSASDNARVISFGDITLTEYGDFNAEGKLVVIPGVNLTKRAYVDFDGSEAATYVFVEITATNWQAVSNYSFAAKSADKMLMQFDVASDWTYLTKNGDTYVYYVALDPNEELNAVDIIAAGGTITVSEYVTRDELQSLADVAIKLRATATQSNGFDSPLAGWTSVSSTAGGAD